MADKAITLGHPSYVWRYGQDRRLNMIRAYLPLEGARVLDIGCGIGAYVEKFNAFGANAFGLDIDLDKVTQGRREKGLVGLALGLSEALPLAGEAFDGVLLHEVIEHVRDDRATIREAHRVVRSGGIVIVFAPNRLYPFETHGAFFGKRYVFGNIPFIGYLPDGLRNKFAPHVRAYRARQVQDLFAGLDGTILVHTQVYPGYDKLASRRAELAHVFRGVTYTLENTPLRTFGLSHFVVWRKD
jgi:SAM-dependent methyltransferase